MVGGINVLNLNFPEPYPLNQFTEVKDGLESLFSGSCFDGSFFEPHLARKPSFCDDFFTLISRIFSE